MVNADCTMWHLAKGQLLAYRRWDQEAVLYNDLSGTTHLLGLAAICVLEKLRNAPATVAALAERLLEEFELDASTLDEELDELLSELSRLSLVEPRAC